MIAELMPPVYSADVAAEISRPAGVARDLTYPEEWLCGWASVLMRSPLAGISPDVVIHDGPSDPNFVDDETEDVLLGAYDPRRHAVHVWPTGDRATDLDTLIHELAHAWSPRERRTKHGALWRLTYCALYEHVTGYAPKVASIYEAARQLDAEHPEIAIRRRGDTRKAAVLDIAFTAQLTNIAHTITIKRIDHADGRAQISATCGGLLHVVPVEIGPHGKTNR